MSLRRIRAVAGKEFLHIVRDRRSLTMALAVPLLMLLLFGYALTLDVDRIPTIVYDADQTPQSRDLIAQFSGSRYFHILGYANDYHVIERGIDRDQCLLGVAIQRNFSRDLLAGRQAEVQLVFDGSDSNTASIAKGYTDAMLETYGSRIRAKEMNRRGGAKLDPPVDGRLRVLYNSQLESKNYIVPGLISVVMAIISSLITSLTIAREWEMGTMEQLLSTPLRPAEVVLGKAGAFFSIGLLDTLISIALGVWLFRVPLRGSMLLLIIASCLFLIGSLCQGILISAAARTQLLAYQMGLLSSFLPAFLLSGFVYSIENMPKVIQAITYIIPARHFVSLLKGVFLKGVGFQVLWVELAFLFVYAALVLFFATKKLRQKVA